MWGSLGPCGNCYEVIFICKMDDKSVSFNIELHTYVFWFINPNPNLRVSQQFLPPFAHISSYYFVSSIRLWNALPYTFVN